MGDQFWSSYFTAVYGGIPSDGLGGYPICTGSFTQIAQKIGGMTTTPTQCADSTATDGALVNALSTNADPDGGIVSYVANSQNFGHVVPDDAWVEVQHKAFAQDKNMAWMYLTFGSAVWWNVGKSVNFKDHADASQGLLAHGCHDDTEHKGAPVPTECEQDFDDWAKTATQQGYKSIQITAHYDCTCAEKGVSSWSGGQRRCPTEILDLVGNGQSGCASTEYKAGWGASKACVCDTSLKYANCKGFGISR